MIDTNKPVQTRGGSPARIIATGVTEEIKGVDAARYKNQTILAIVTTADYGDVVRYFSPNGSFMGREGDPDDLVNVEPETVEYFTLGDAYSSFASADDGEFPVLKVTRRGTKVISAEIVDEA